MQLRQLVSAADGCRKQTRDGGGKRKGQKMQFPLMELPQEILFVLRSSLCNPGTVLVGSEGDADVPAGQGGACPLRLAVAAPESHQVLRVGSKFLCPDLLCEIFAVGRTKARRCSACGWCEHMKKMKGLILHCSMN